MADSQNADIVFTDPVCKMRISGNEITGQTIFKDQTYVFCSNDCEQLFLENPKKYIYNNSTVSEGKQNERITTKTSEAGVSLFSRWVASFFRRR